MTAIVPLETLEQRADYFADLSISRATRRAYESDWRHFYGFCRDLELQELPSTPETVCLYLSAMADKQAAVSTIIRRLTSISAIHRAAGHDSPTKHDKVFRVMKGIKRSCGRPPGQAKAISWHDLNRLIAQCDSLMIGLRDAALLALGWSSALRRSELVALDVGDLDFVEQGLVVTLTRSKTDQEGQGYHIGIPRAKAGLCPVETVRRWIQRQAWDDTVSGADTPLFCKIGNFGRGRWWSAPAGRLSARMVSEIVKRYATYAGLNPELYSAHSLRRGLATEAGARGVPERVISRHTRHRSLAVLRGYIEDGTIWADNPLPAIYSSSAPVPGLE
jgi:integrase